MYSGTRRTQKVASLIQSVLARLLIEEVSDPRLKAVVITEVVLTKDLREATIYYARGEGNPKEIDQGIKRALPFFRRRLGEEVELRHVPELFFEVDTHGDNLNRLLHLFDDVNREAQGSAAVAAQKTGNQNP